MKSLNNDQKVSYIEKFITSCKDIFHRVEDKKKDLIINADSVLLSQLLNYKDKKD